MLKYILLILVLLLLAAQNGKLGRTSTATVRVSITILPKVEVVNNPSDPNNPKIVTNISAGTFEEIRVTKNGITTIILEPK